MAVRELVANVDAGKRAALGGGLGALEARGEARDGLGREAVAGHGGNCKDKGSADGGVIARAVKEAGDDVVHLELARCRALADGGAHGELKARDNTNFNTARALSANKYG